MYDSALILKIGKFREYDAWVRLLTKNNGICTAFAFGASKSRRRFAGCLDNFNIVNAVIEKNPKNSLLQLKETSLLVSSPLRTNWKLIGIVNHCLRFVESMDVSSDTNEASFYFVVNFITQLDKHPQQATLFPPLFKFKFASIQGYAPHIHSCIYCMSDLTVKSDILFSVEDGAILCEDCAEKLKNASHQYNARHIKTSLQTIKFLQYIQENEVEKYFSFSIPHHVFLQYTRIIDAFIQYHIGLEWNKTKFIRI